MPMLKAALDLHESSRLAPVQAPVTLHQAALIQLRTAIVLGKLKPGAPLKDAELAAQLGLSTTPVREALVKLSTEGLVEIIPNRLKRVAPIDYALMVELLEVQNRLWAMGYEWGIPHIERAGLARLQQCNEMHRQAIKRGDVPAAVIAAQDFHSVVMEASGNRELVRVSLDRVPLIQRFVVLCIPWFPSPTMAKLYRDMLHGAQRGNAKEAVSAFNKLSSALLKVAIRVRDTGQTQQPGMWR